MQRNGTKRALAVKAVANRRWLLATVTALVVVVPQYALPVSAAIAAGSDNNSCHVVMTGD